MVRRLDLLQNESTSAKFDGAIALAALALDGAQASR
jgi:hypothetical protein